MVIAVAAFGSAWLQNPRSSSIPVDKRLCFSASVREVNATNTGSALYLKIDSLGSSPASLLPFKSNRAVVYISVWPENFPIGSRIVFYANFKPHDIRHDLPFETDPGDFLLRRRIFISAILSPSSIVASYPPSGLKGWLTAKIDLFRQGLFRSNLSNRNISFLNTITTGDTSVLLPSSRQIFSSSGLAHILALSGMHIGLIAWIITLALWPLKLTGRLWPSILITLIFLWAYAIATGMSPSVMRAVLMASFFSLAFLTHRQRGGINSLCAAVIALLIIWPDSLLSIAFQMSVAAVASILIFAEPLNPVPEHKKNYHYLFNLIIIPLSAFLGTSVIAAFYFHSLPVYFIFSNIAASILLLPTMVCGIALGITQALGFDFLWLSSLTSWLCDAIFSVADFFSSLPGSTLSGIWIPAGTIIPSFIALILFRLTFHYKSRLCLLSTLIVALIATLPFFFSSRPSGINGVLLPSTLKSTVAIFSNPSDNSLSVCALAPENFTHELSHLSNMRYTQFSVAARFDSISVSSSPSVKHFLQILTANSSARIAILSADSLLSNSPSPQFLLITAAPKAAQLSSVRDLNVDTVLISAAIPPAKAAKITSNLSELNLPVKYLREAPHFFANP